MFLAFGVARAGGCGPGRSWAGWGWGEARGVAWHGGRGLGLRAFREADARSWQSPVHSARSLHAPRCGLHPWVPTALEPNSRP